MNADSAAIREELHSRLRVREFLEARITAQGIEDRVHFELEREPVTLLRCQQAEQPSEFCCLDKQVSLNVHMNMVRFLRRSWQVARTQRLRPKRFRQLELNLWPKRR